MTYSDRWMSGGSGPRPSAAWIWALLVALAGCTSDRGGARAKPLVDAGRDATLAATADVSAPELADASGAHHYDSSIYSFVACNVYHDFPSLDVKQDSKFEIFLDPAITPGQIESLRVFGPAGFTFEFMNAPFLEASNGYLYNDREPVLWYQAIRAGTLADGRYTLEVTFKDGFRGRHSRELASNFALRDYYLAHKSEMHYSPGSGVSPANDTTLSWSTFHDLGGPDAYYNVWISSGTAEAISGDTARGDNIFVAALLDSKAGLNAGMSQQGSATDPLPVGPQTWQVEILDANVLDGIDMIVFTSAVHFTTR